MSITFCFLRNEYFYPACWWRQKILQVVFYVHLPFCHPLHSQNQCWIFFQQALTASECDLCQYMWQSNASCWRVALRMWVYSSLLVWFMAICWIQWPVESNFGKTAVLCACAVWSSVWFYTGTIWMLSVELWNPNWFFGIFMLSKA